MADKQTAPIGEIVAALREDTELSALDPTVWTRLSELHAGYEAGRVEKKALNEGLISIFPKKNVIAAVKKVTGGGKKKAAAAPQASATPAEVVAVRPAPAAAVAGTKRAAPSAAPEAAAEPAKGPPGKRAKGAIAEGYAAAAEAGGGDEPAGADDSKPETVEGQFDPLAVAGVDEAELQRGGGLGEVHTTEGGDDEALLLGPGGVGEALQARLAEVGLRFGLEGADERAARAVAIALQTHVVDILDQLRPLSAQRRNLCARAPPPPPPPTPARRPSLHASLASRPSHPACLPACQGQAGLRPRRLRGDPRPEALVEEAADRARADAQGPKASRRGRRRRAERRRALRHGRRGATDGSDERRGGGRRGGRRRRQPSRRGGACHESRRARGNHRAHARQALARRALVVLHGHAAAKLRQGRRARVRAAADAAQGDAAAQRARGAAQGRTQRAAQRGRLTCGTAGVRAEGGRRAGLAHLS